MSTTKKPEQEHTEASPPKPPATPAPGDLQSINEPPVPAKHEQKPSADVSVSREAKHETENDHKRHR